MRHSEPFGVVGFRRRFRLALLAALLLYIILIAGAITPLTPSEVAEKVKELEGIVSGIEGAFDIFLNNFMIALVMLVPFLGPIIGSYVIYQTGTYIGAIASNYGLSLPVALAIPVLTGYGFLEFLGYGVAMTESALLIYALVKKSLKKELLMILFTIALVFGILALAALIEELLIELFLVLSI